jgi:hypothetical protein
MTREETLSRYRHLRAINTRQQTDALKFINRGTMMDYGRRLGVLHRRTFVCEETELTFVFDLAVHAAREGRTRGIDRYAHSVRPAEGSDEAMMLKAARQARFALWRVDGLRHPAGLSIHDIATGQDLWLLDEGLETCNPTGAVVAARLMPVEDFVMTCGVLVPIDRDVLDELAETAPRLGGRDLTAALRNQRFVMAIYRAAITLGAVSNIEFIGPYDERLTDLRAA